MIRPPPFAGLRCDECGQPASHAEHYYTRLRSWCEQHTPWSGHYEFCGAECERLILEARARDVELRYYKVPSLQGEGWGHFVVGSNGFFATVSDFGNYAFLWRDPGGEFRKFLCGLNADYLMSKLAPKKVYDGVGTERSIRAAICRLRRAGRLGANVARQEWDSIDLYELEHVVGYYEWYQRTHLPDAHEEAPPSYIYSPELQGFVKHVWPRFVALVSAEYWRKRTPMQKVTSLRAKRQPSYLVRIIIDRKTVEGGNHAPWEPQLVECCDQFARTVAESECVFETELVLGMKTIAHYVPSQIAALKESLEGRGYLKLAKAIEADQDVGVEVLKLLTLTPKEGEQL